MRVLKQRGRPPKYVSAFERQLFAPRRSDRRSLRLLEDAGEEVILSRLKQKWPGLVPAFGIAASALRRQGLPQVLPEAEAQRLGIRPWAVVHPVDAEYHIPEMVAALEWRLRQLIEHPAQVRLIDGVRVTVILGSLLLVKWPSGQLGTFAWYVDSSGDPPPTLVRMPVDQVVLQGMPWRWLWLDRLMRGFASELQGELIRRGWMTAPALQTRSQTFGRYLNDLAQVMKHRLRAMPAYRCMRQRIAQALQLDPVALALSHRIADAGAHLSQHTTMVSSYNRAVEHRDLLRQVQAEAPRLLTFYAGMLEDDDFPTQGEPLERLRLQLYAHLRSHGPYRLLLKTSPRRFVLMRRFIAHLQHENYLDWLRLLHGLSPAKPIPEWLLSLLVAQYGNERERAHLYARRFWPRIQLWAQLVGHWVDVDTTPSDADLLAIGEVALWIADGPATAPDRRQRQQGWAGMVERARAWLEERSQQAQRNPLPLASRIPPRSRGDWMLVPLRTQHDLWQEGKFMGHCLGQNNGPQPSETTWFASLQHQGKRVLTCQFERENRRNRLVSALGRFNANPTEAQRQALHEVLVNGVNQKSAPLPQAATNTGPVTASKTAANGPAYQQPADRHAA